MKKNISYGITGIRVLCGKLAKFGESIWGKHLILPLFFALPAFCASFLVNNIAKLQQWATNHNHSSIASSISEHPLRSQATLYLIIFFWINFILYAGALIKKFSKPEYTLDTEDLLFLEKSLNIAVSGKASRFSDSAKKQLRAPLNSNKIFETITQPEQQMKLICTAMQVFLEHLDEKYFKGSGNVQVGIMRMKNNMPIEWLAYSPSRPTASVEQLNTRNSTLSVCARKRKLQHIKNIEEEAEKFYKNQSNRYQPIHGRGEDKGSLICIPYCCDITQSVPYVIVLFTETPYYFKPEELFVDLSFKRFEDRLSIENSLLIIKEAIANEKLSEPPATRTNSKSHSQNELSNT